MKRFGMGLLLLACCVSACSGHNNSPTTAPAPVIPNYTGIWSGTYTVTSCTQNGLIAIANLCGTAGPGSVLVFQLNLGQIGSTIVQGNFTLGGLGFTIVPATLTSAGAVTVSGTHIDGTVTILATWNLNTPITGTLTQVWSSSGLTGQVNLTGTIGGVAKTGGLIRSPIAAPESIKDLIRALQEK